MSVNVKIPTPLRRFAGEKSELAVDAQDVAGALAKLLDAHPALKPQLLADSGAVRSFVNLFVNGEDVRFLDGPKTAVKDGDTLAIIPAIAGGSGR
jgi:molybdopterin converting factor small subunit